MVHGRWYSAHLSGAKSAGSAVPLRMPSMYILMHRHSGSKVTNTVKACPSLTCHSLAQLHD
eukprot:1194158-Prorocentrum_minimum.AAC.1